MVKSRAETPGFFALFTARAKFRSREGHASEDSAGIVFFGYDAFLVRDAVFLGIHEVLSLSRDSNNREESDGYRKESARGGIVTHAAFNSVVDRIRDVTARAEAAAFIRFLLFVDSEGENDRIDKFDCRRRKIAGRGAERDGRTEGFAHCGFEHLDVAFSSVEHSLFVDYRDTFKGLRLVVSDTRLEGYLQIESDADRIETSVKGNRVDGDVRKRNRSLENSDARRAVDDVISAVGEENFDVFEAIAVSAGIEHSGNFKADVFPNAGILGIEF